MIFVFVTIDTIKNARNLVYEVVKSRLAACGNIIEIKESIYRWRGKIESSPECLVIFKTMKKNYKKLERKILELHPYEVPEIVELKAGSVYEKYKKWIKEE